MNIYTIYKFTNGLIMAFDENGKQCPDYQGKYSKELHLKLFD